MKKRRYKVTLEDPFITESGKPVHLYWLTYYSFTHFCFSGLGQAVRPGPNMDSPTMLFFFLGCKSVLFHFVWESCDSFQMRGSINSTYLIAIQAKFKCNIDLCCNLYWNLEAFKFHSISRCDCTMLSTLLGAC
jgi:hypothetical protein